MARYYIAGALAVLVISAANYIPDMNEGQADAVKPVSQPVPALPYWQQRGCQHKHPSRVARSRIKRLLKNLRPLNATRAKRVKHYATCVATKAKAHSVHKYARRLYAWRKQYPQVHEIQFNKYPVAVRNHLYSIAMCESGGNPRAISGDGIYRGKYQFDYRTWGEVGGYGDPVNAHEFEQDHRAAMLYVRAGSGRWPVCQH